MREIEGQVTVTWEGGMSSFKESEAAFKAGCQLLTGVDHFARKLIKRVEVLLSQDAGGPLDKFTVTIALTHPALGDVVVTWKRGGPVLIGTEGLPSYYGSIACASDTPFFGPDGFMPLLSAAVSKAITEIAVRMKGTAEKFGTIVPQLDRMAVGVTVEPPEPSGE